MCKKRRFKNEATADAELERAKSKARPECRAYRCPDCAGWHLSSKKRKERVWDKTKKTWKRKE